MNFARLNHILIPATRDGRDRLRHSRAGRLLRPLGNLYRGLTVEGQFLSVFWLVCGAAGLEVGGTQIYLLWCLLTGVMAAGWILRRGYRMDKIRASVEGPARLVAGEVGCFTCRLSSQRDQAVRGFRLIRPLLPWDGAWVGPRPGLGRLPSGGAASLTALARFRARGEHHLDPFFVARLVPLGLHLGPALETESVRFLVVPKPAKLASLQLPRAARYQPGGAVIHGVSGDSREFVGVRPYRPGDAIRDLHHRSWARTGYPVVREYRQEYFTRIGIVLDTDLAVADEAALEAAISLCCGVLDHVSGAEVSQGEALIDLLILGGRVHRLAIGPLTPGHCAPLGRVAEAHELLACLDSGPGFEPDVLVGSLQPHLAQLSSVVCVLLGWDAPRRAAVDAIRAGNTAVLCLVVSHQAPSEAGALHVSPAQIRADEALRL